MNTITQPMTRTRTFSRAAQVAIVYFVSVASAVLLQTLMQDHLYPAIVQFFGTLVMGYLCGYFLLLPVVLAALRWALSGWAFALAAMIGSQTLFFALWTVHPLLRLNQPLAAFAQEYTFATVSGNTFMHNGLLYVVSLAVALGIAFLCTELRNADAIGQPATPIANKARGSVKVLAWLSIAAGLYYLVIGVRGSHLAEFTGLAGVVAGFALLKQQRWVRWLYLMVSILLLSPALRSAPFILRYFRSDHVTLAGVGNTLIGLLFWFALSAAMTVFVFRYFRASKPNTRELAHAG